MGQEPSIGQGRDRSLGGGMAMAWEGAGAWEGEKAWEGASIGKGAATWGRTGTSEGERA